MAVAAPVSDAPTLPGWPLLGQLPAVQRDVLGTFERAARLGDLVRMDFPGRTGFLVNHPDGVRRVLVDHHRNYGKSTRGYQMLAIALGQGLVTSQGELWRRQRRIAQPAFHHQRIAPFLATMDAAGLRMLERWRREHPAGSELEVDREMMRVTLEIVGRCLMSTDLSDDSGAVGRDMGIVLREMVWRATHPLALPLLVPTPHNRRMQVALARLHRVVIRIIEERRAGRGDAGDLLDLLMAARDEETGEGMTDEQLRDEVMTMVSAGHETTANALAWTLHFLSQHPEARSRLEEEVDAVLGDAPLEPETLGRLAYTEACLKEAMRLRPPVWLLARNAIEDDEILGHPIPAGSIVFLPQFLLHKDPRFWERPLAFEPERFLGDRARGISRFVYFPFAAGPRVCIGQGFAMMEGKILLGRLVHVARLTGQPGRAAIPEPTITLRPRGGLPMTLSWR